jgi:hypothetical protein
VRAALQRARGAERLAAEAMTQREAPARRGAKVG